MKTIKELKEQLKNRNIKKIVDIIKLRLNNVEIDDLIEKLEELVAIDEEE